MKIIYVLNPKSKYCLKYMLYTTGVLKYCVFNHNDQILYDCVLKTWKDSGTWIPCFASLCFS